MLVDLLRDEEGQSITEYAAILAFVGVLIAMIFSMTQSGLFATLTQSYSTATNALSQLNEAALSST